MPIRHVYGRPYHAGGQPVIGSEPCCCGEEPCECTEPKSGPCECVNDEYEADRAAPDMLLTIAGSAPYWTAPPVSCPIVLPGNCPDPRGTYLISCGDVNRDLFCDEVEKCANPGNPNPNQWARVWLKAEYNKQYIEISVDNSGLRCDQAGFFLRGSWRWDFTAVDDWEFLLIPPCAEECNSIVTNYKCADQLDWVLTDTVVSTAVAVGGCTINGLTASLSVV